jgi:hypothetical protein
MTPTEFADAMMKIARTSSGDPEAAHGNADDLLCKVLTELGYGEGVKVFEGMDKWYA